MPGLLAIALAALLSGIPGILAPRVEKPSRAQNPVVALRLSVAGRVATLKIPNKGCVSIRAGDDPTIRIYAEINGDDVELAAWRTADDLQPCAPPPAALRGKTAVKGMTELALAELKIQVEFLTIASALATPTGGQGPCTECCVTCQGITFCACEVETVCGRCCCPDACGCQPAAIAQK